MNLKRYETNDFHSFRIFFNGKKIKEESMEACRSFSLLRIIVKMV